MKTDEAADRRQAQQFLRERGIRQEGVLPCVHAALALTLGVHRAVLDELRGARPARATWGLLHRMVDRGQEHAQASLTLWATGFPAQAEGVARSTFEHAVTLLYVLRDPTDALTAAYLRQFVHEEQRNIGQLRAVAATAPDGDTLARAALRREEALRGRRDYVAALVSELGLDPDVPRVWPKLLDRCRQLGLERTYRETYHQISAQAHGDPEDLLNELVARQAGPASLERLAVETVEFSWLLTREALDVHLTALGEFSATVCGGRAEPVAQAARAELKALVLMEAEG